MQISKKIFKSVLAIIIALSSLFAASCAEQAELGVSVPSAGKETEFEIKDAAADDNVNVTGSSEDNASEEQTDGRQENGFVFVYNETVVYLGDEADNVLKRLGTEVNSFESDSCIFDGTLKTYIYSGFEISVYAETNSNEYIVYSIVITDDSISTYEGIFTGQTADDLLSVYGEAYSKSPGFYYKYLKDGTMLTFDVDDNDVIIYITYEYLNIS